MTSKYKPTDLVRIKELEEVRKTNGWLSSMDGYAGKIVTICGWSSYGFYLIKECGYEFSDSMIAGLAEEKKTVRVRVDKSSSNHRHYDHLVGKEIEVEEFGNDSNNRYWLEKVGAIYKSDCTIITKEPDKVVPPGYPGEAYQELFDAINESSPNPLLGQMHDIIRIVHKNHKDYNLTSKLPPPEEHPEPVDKPVPYEIVKRWMERIEKAIQTGRNIYVANCVVEEWEDYNGGDTSKSAPPEPGDRERLQKYVLALAEGNPEGENYTPGQHATRILELAVAMMKAVDNFKPDSK